MFTAGKMFPNNWPQVEAMLKFSGYDSRLPEFRKIYGPLKEKVAVAAIATDRAFWVDYVRCADAQAGFGNVFAYRFDFVHTVLKLIGFGAMHGAEINHMLNTTGSLGKMLVPLTSKARIENLRRNTHQAWINFTKTGNPNGHLPMDWPQYDSNNRATFIFNDICRIVENPNIERFELWKDIALFSQTKLASGTLN
jgi:para-nitrobenzyl esterase